jgi:predicted RNA-binding protein
MRPAKRTYTLPPGERSSSLAKIIEERLAKREREELRHLIVEGCEAVREEYQRVDREWAAAADEVWHDGGR